MAQEAIRQGGNTSAGGPNLSASRAHALDRALQLHVPPAAIETKVNPEHILKTAEMFRDYVQDGKLPGAK